MDIMHAVINAVVQGLTEFLPVSSSGHLVLASSIYKIVTGKQMISGGSEEIFLDIMLHVGTLIAILVYFKNDLIHLWTEFNSAIKNKSFQNNEEAKFPLYIAVSTLATIVTVLPLKDYFEANMEKPAIVGICIMITGVLLMVTEFLSSKNTHKTSTVGWIKSIIIGIAQGIAVAPGISRSGSTIAAGLATGLDRKTCARYSFLMSIPAILMGAAASAVELVKSGNISHINWTAILIGTVISGIVGYYCVKYFISYLVRHDLNIFAYYCLIVGFSMFLYFGHII